MTLSQGTLLGIVGLCWLGLCVRLWDLSRKSHSTALGWVCGGMLTLALSITLQINAIVRIVDAGSMQDMAGTLSNCLTLTALTCFQCAFLHMIHNSADAARPVRTQVWSCAAVAVAMVILLVLFGSNYPDVIATAASDEHIPVISAAGYVYVVYFGVSTAKLTISSWSYAKITTRFSLRVGMVLMSLGLVIGLGYGAARLASMATYQLGPHIRFLHGDLIGDLFRIAIVVELVGIVFPFLGPRIGLDALANRLRVNRSLRALHPLWHALQREFPAIVLDAPDPSPDRLLYRRVIEIWDGRLQLRPYFDTATADRVRARASTAMSVADREAAVEAAPIADALQCRATRRPHQTPVEASQRPSADEDDVTWLTRVSKAFVQQSG